MNNTPFLDDSIKDQLKTVFSRLTHNVHLTLTQKGSDPTSTQELVAFLGEIASTSEKIIFDPNLTSDLGSPLTFSVHCPEKSATPSILFRGIPGGHELSSLVIAILNVDHQGKLPDDGIQQRIKNLKGPIQLQTYVSLSCENCPEVVQALNQIAVIHPDFIHETIDGGIAQSEIDNLGIQGVPSVIHQGKLLHSGKINFISLLQKLEEHFGVTPLQEQADTTKHLGTYDMVIVGGGPAGASAAIYTARKGLKVALVAERMGGQLKDTLGIENMISLPYTEGSKLTAQLQEHLSMYPIKIFEHRKVDRIVDGDIKTIQINGGETLQAEQVILATGAQWRRLNIPGETEHIGQGVAFCAHCDGPFYKNKKVVIVGGGNSGVEAALDLSAIAEQVTLLEYGPSLRADPILVKKLQEKNNTQIITHAKSTEVLGSGGKVTGLRYQDLRTEVDTELHIDGVFVQIGLSPNTQFVKDFVTLTSNGEIQVDPKGRTSVRGVYAAGDVAPTPFKQIIVAMGDGAKVALTAFEDRMRNPLTTHSA